MQVIFLVRHGESEWNKEGKVQGFRDSNLSELGREQARRVGKALTGENLQIAVTSSAARAVDTCSLALGVFGAGIPIEETPHLREINLGVWEGIKASELKKRYPQDVEMWFQRPSRVKIKGGETLRSFRARVIREMKRLRQVHQDKTIVVFTHGGVICAYLTSILGMRLDDLWRFKIRNGSISKVIFPREKPRIELLGGVHHLDGAIHLPPKDGFRIFP